MSSAGNIDCSQVRLHLDELLNGADDSDVPCADMRAHAETCPDCADAIVRERHMKALLRRCCKSQAPTELRTAIVSSISTRVVRSRSTRA